MADPTELQLVEFGSNNSAGAAGNALVEHAYDPTLRPNVYLLANGGLSLNSTGGYGRVDVGGQVVANEVADFLSEGDLFRGKAKIHGWSLLLTGRLGILASRTQGRARGGMGVVAMLFPAA